MFDQFLLSREHCIAHGLPLDSPFERQVESLISQPLPDNSTKIDALKRYIHFIYTVTRPPFLILPQQHRGKSNSGLKIEDGRCKALSRAIKR